MGALGASHLGGCDQPLPVDPLGDDRGNLTGILQTGTKGDTYHGGSNAAVILSTGTDGTTVLKFDTQAEHTILSDPAFFVDGVDSTHTLAISTITPDADVLPRTSGCGTATVVTLEGVVIRISNAHLYPEGNCNVVATRAFQGKAVPCLENQTLDLPDGTRLPFDAGYCDMRVTPPGARSTPVIEPRHPDATAAILIT